MERIISYDELPRSNGESIYLRMETDPKLYISLLSKGYRVINDILDADTQTVFVTGNRQIYGVKSQEEYISKLDAGIQYSLKRDGITKPTTTKFSIEDLLDHKYQIPFVLKNEGINGGREKFLINTEEDYECLVNSVQVLLGKEVLLRGLSDSIEYKINYERYLNKNFVVQEYVPTPSKYNTTVRLLTSPSNDLLYASLKYKEAEKHVDDTTLLGYLLGKTFPLSTPSIVSNTLSGGKNILIGEGKYPNIEKALLKSHDIGSDSFQKLVQAAQSVHQEYQAALGLICGFDFIYDREREKWYMLEYHSKPMVGDYVTRQNIPYESKEDRIAADGRVRATALSLTLKKTR